MKLIVGPCEPTPREKKQTVICWAILTRQMVAYKQGTAQAWPVGSKQFLNFNE